MTSVSRYLTRAVRVPWHPDPMAGSTRARWDASPRPAGPWWSRSRRVPSSSANGTSPSCPTDRSGSSTTPRSSSAPARRASCATRRAPSARRRSGRSPACSRSSPGSTRWSSAPRSSERTSRCPRPSRRSSPRTRCSTPPKACSTAARSRTRCTRAASTAPSSRADALTALQPALEQFGKVPSPWRKEHKDAALAALTLVRAGGRGPAPRTGRAARPRRSA